MPSLQFTILMHPVGWILRYSRTIRLVLIAIELIGAASLLTFKFGNAGMYVVVLLSHTAYLIFLNTQNSSDMMVPHNFSMIDRRSRISRLLSVCTEELTIVAGVFHRNIYDDKEVLDKLANLPDGVTIKLYRTENEIDTGATRFLALLSKLNLEIYAIDSDTPHVIIVDRKHIRIESPLSKKARSLDGAVDQNSGEKLGVFFYFQQELAETYAKLVERKARAFANEKTAGNHEKLATVGSH